MSNYPPGSENDPNAPWNQRDPDTMDCPDCEGSGLCGHDCGEDTCCCLNPEDNLSCAKCGGSGEVEAEDF